MIDACFMAAQALVTALRKGELSARELTQAHLNRIEEVNPQVNAIVTLTAERALEQARVADERQAAGETLGPLHGLPMAHKDGHMTAGIRSTSGSPIFADHVPTRNDLIIDRIQDAGAITLGKTNMPEFGAGSHTFNPLFGTTFNPYDLTKSAGGSTGGGAAGLAAGLQALADGSDIGGSLRNPASFCNVAGLRPSAGRVPAYPDSWSHLAVSGPMGRYVGDVALLLSVISGLPVPPERDLTGMRMAWSPDLGGSVAVDAEVTEVLSAQIPIFQELGCSVEEDCPDFTGADDAFRVLRAWEFELNLGGLLDRHRDRLKPSIVWNIEEGRRLRTADIRRAQATRATLFERMEAFFDRYDTLLLPVTQVAPFDAELEYPQTVAGRPQETYLDWMRSCYYVSIASSPALSVPAGFTKDELPVGLQIVGRYLDERTVLQVGKAFEGATKYADRHPALPA